MKFSVVIGALLFELFLQPLATAINEAATSNIRSIYLFKDVMKSDTASLKTSGFNTLVIFGVGILGNGDIMVRCSPRNNFVSITGFLVLSFGYTHTHFIILLHQTNT